jgi:hypothetical protein
VNEYFAPWAKKRWCVSLYGSGGQQPTGVFQQVSIELGSIFSSRLLNFLCNTVVSVSFPTAIIHFPTHPICKLWQNFTDSLDWIGPQVF